MSKSPKSPQRRESRTKLKHVRKLKLQPELVPASLWGISGYRLLSRSAWKAIRAEVLKELNNTCQGCGQTPSALHGDPLNCHEQWEYDDKRHIATLIGFELHCKDCHTALHTGRAMTMGFGEQALQQLCKVNGISMREAEELHNQCMAVWQKRSRKEWTIKIHESLLKKYPKLVILEDKAAEQ